MYEIYKNEIRFDTEGEKDSFPLHNAVISYVRWFTQVVLKQCDELEFIKINMTASPGLGCLKTGKREWGWITLSTG